MRIINKYLLSVDPVVAVIVLPCVWPILIRINGTHLFVKRCIPYVLICIVGTHVEDSVFT